MVALSVTAYKAWMCVSNNEYVVIVTEFITDQHCDIILFLREINVSALSERQVMTSNYFNMLSTHVLR